MSTIEIDENNRLSAKSHSKTLKIIIVCRQKRGANLTWT